MNYCVHGITDHNISEPESLKGKARVSGRDPSEEK